MTQAMIDALVADYLARGGKITVYQTTDRRIS